MGHVSVKLAFGYFRGAAVGFRFRGAAFHPPSTMMVARGQALKSVNFPKGAKAYDESYIPPHNLASKKEVQAAKVPERPCE